MNAQGDHLAPLSRQDHLDAAEQCVKIAEDSGDVDTITKYTQLAWLRIELVRERGRDERPAVSDEEGR